MPSEILEFINEIKSILNIYLGIESLIKFFLIISTIIGSYVTCKGLTNRIINKIIKQFTNKIHIE